MLAEEYYLFQGIEIHPEIDEFFKFSEKNDINF